jgi:hypothetical protein
VAEAEGLLPGCVQTEKSFPKFTITRKIDIGDPVEVENDEVKALQAELKES